eukprot:366131-Chlamydomonas_euryale.AAC.22
MPHMRSSVFEEGDVRAQEMHAELSRHHFHPLGPHVGAIMCLCPSTWTACRRNDVPVPIHLGRMSAQ